MTIARGVAFRYLIACFVAIVAFCTAIGAVTVMPSPASAAVLGTVGGTGNASGHGVENLIGGTFIDGRTVEAIRTPQQLWPVNGTMTLDQSIEEGAPNVITWVMNTPDPNKKIIAISQGSVVLSFVIAYYNDHPANAPPPDELSFVLVANPMRPNGGFLARFPGLSFLGITGHGPTEQSQYQVIDAANAYDGYAVTPLYVGNLLTVLNGLAGVAFPYENGMSLHSQDPDYTNPDLDVRTTVVGNTTYYTIIPDRLPMYMPLVNAGLGPLVDIIEPLTKVWVNAGYYKNDPAADPGTHRPVQLFMPAENIVRALKQTPGAIMEGLATIPGNLKPKKTTSVDDNQDDPSSSATPPLDSPEVVSNAAVSTTQEPPVDPEPVVATKSTRSAAVGSEPQQPAATEPSPEEPKQSDSSSSSVTTSGTVVSGDDDPSDSPKSTPKSTRKAWKPGDGIKRALDSIHKATHGNTPKKSAVSSGGAAQGSSASSDSGGDSE